MSPQEDLLVEVRKAIQRFSPEIEQAVGVKSIEILNEGIRQEGRWWHIPVLARPDPRRNFPYYELLAEIEIDLHKNHDVRVLLEPIFEDDLPNPPVH